MNSRIQLRSVAFVAAVACVASRGWGYQVVGREDVDSLYYLSQTIAKVEVGAAHPEQTVDGNCVVYEVKVLEVLKGEATVGKTYNVTGLDAFRLSPGLPGRADSWGTLGAGEVVYVFLAPKATARYAMYRLVDAEWTVIDSGAELEVAGRVYGFAQGELDLSNPAALQNKAPMGAQVAMTPMVFPKALVYSEKEFAARVERARGVVAEVEKALKVEASEAQIAALAEMLRGRRAVMQAEGATVDAVGRALGRRLAEIGTGKPEVLDGLYQDADRGLRMELTEGFGTGTGVAYLLAHVADEKAPMEKRLAWAEVLAEISRAAPRVPQMRAAGVPADLDVDLAKLAMANLDNKLMAALLPGLWAPGLGREPKPELLAVLQEGYAKGTAAQKFAIAESVMQMDMRTYRAMFGGLGSFLTLATPDRDFAAGLKQGVIKASFRFRGSTFFARELKMVLRPAGGGAERVLAVTSPANLPANTNTFGSGWAVTAEVPADLAAGKYEVFLRGDGDGLGFEMEIPGK